MVLQKEDLRMYNQILYKIVEPLKINTVKRLNKKKAWKYGYNKEHDIVVISKTGQIGDIYEIQNFQIALTPATKVHSRSKKKKLLVVLQKGDLNNGLRTNSIQGCRTY